MNPFDAIEKWIKEHASAAVLREHLDLLRSQSAVKDAKIADLERLLKEKDARIKNLEIQKPADECPYCRRPTGELQEIKPDRYLGRVGVKNGYYKCSSCGKDYEKKMA